MDQVRERARYLHFSLATEKAYLYWIRFFIRWSGMKHPRDMGAREVEAFLTMLATERRVSSSTHNQSLSALLFLYREVLGLDLPWLTEVSRPTRAKRLPSVLTREEVASLLASVSGEAGLVAHLLYGTGLRLIYPTAAVTTTSTRHSAFANAARTVARGGAFPGATHASHTSFIPAKSARSARKICVIKMRDLSVPARCKSASIAASTCRVCPRISCVASSGICPAK
jgi:hypothetical protein